MQILEWVRLQNIMITFEIDKCNFVHIFVITESCPVTRSKWDKSSKNIKNQKQPLFKIIFFLQNILEILSISIIVNLLGTVISDFPIQSCKGPMDSI